MRLSWPEIRAKAPKFALRDLPRHVEHFTFILGVERRAFRSQDPANIEASEPMGSLHDALKAARWTSSIGRRLFPAIASGWTSIRAIREVCFPADGGAKETARKDDRIAGTQLRLIGA